jgi:hypothetical protein
MRGLKFGRSRKFFSITGSWYTLLHITITLVWVLGSGSMGQLSFFYHCGDTAVCLVL